MITVERSMSSTSTKMTSRTSSCSSASSTRKQNRSEFAKYYSDLCHIQHAHPLSAIKQNLDKGILDFYCDRMKFDEWWSVINALRCDKSLHLVAIRCRHPQKQALESADTELKARATTKHPVVTTRFVLLWLADAVRMCLGHSSTLTVLELEGLPLLGDYLATVGRGLLETTSLQHLSLCKCSIRDDGTELVCNAVKNLPSVASLDLSQCGLTERGAEIVAGLVKYQKLNRYSEAWKQTLRYRDPDVEAMPGLRRITLNGNSEIGDRGIHILAEEIKDDLWLRALDVQDCGLTDEGGMELLDLLFSNGNLFIVDGRGNPHMSEKTLLEIMNQLAANNQNKNNTEYKWINKNPDLNKKKPQSCGGKQRPWTCRSSPRLNGKAPPPSERCSSATSARPAQLKRSYTVLNPNVILKPQRNAVTEKPKTSENELLRLQLRDLTLILNKEIRDKLALMEENKQLKELLEKEENERKRLEEIQSNKVLIAEDTLKVLQETIVRFGMYLEQKQDEDEETSESTTNRSNDDSEIPDLISNLNLLLKKATNSSSDQTNLNKTKYLNNENILPERKTLIDLKNDRNQENVSRKVHEKRKAKQLSVRQKSQVIWEEEEEEEEEEEDEDDRNLGYGDTIESNRTEGGKSKAQVMFLQLLEKGRQNSVRSRKVPSDLNLSTDPDTQDEISSNDSDYDSKSAGVTEKALSSSDEDNSS